MSRHFELMEQMEAERLLVSKSLPKAANPVPEQPVAPINSSVPSVEASSLPVTRMHQAEVQVAVPTASLVAASIETQLQTTPPISVHVPVRVEQPAALRRPAAILRKPSHEPRWASAEALRLVQQIFLQKAQASPAVVVFAGLDFGNGCSEVCASVAETLARTAGKSVCLIEANLRSPALSGLFGTTNDYGLVEALSHLGPVRSFTRQVADENLWLLSSGTVEASSPNLLVSHDLQGRLAELRSEFAYVVIDAPPLNRHSDAVLLGQLSDGLVMVLGTDASQRESASDAAASLRSARVAILAAVLNKGASTASPTNSI